MSLINDMLRDLEARRPEGGRDALHGVSAVNGHRRGWIRFIALGSLTTVVVAGVLWAAYAPEGGRRAGEPVASASEPRTVPVKIPEAPEPGAATEPESGIVHISEARLERRGERLELVLAAGEPLHYRFERLQDGRHLRLKVPDGELTANFPDLVSASALVETASAQPRQNAWQLDIWVGAGTRAQTHSRDGGKALVLSLTAARPVEADQSSADAADNREADSPPEPPAESMEAAEDRSAVEEAVAADEGSAPDAARGPANATGPAGEEESRFTKRAKRGADASLTRRVEQARARLDDGDPASAGALLREVLEADERRHQARTLLARAYMIQGRPQAAAATLEAGMALEPAHTPFIIQLARLLAGAGETERALGVLERRAPESPSAEYLALNGALSQQLGRHQQAARAYRRAIQARPDNAGWWVGLAIAQEGAGEVGEALASYQEGLSRGGLRPALRAYARQRVEQIRP